MVPVLKKTARDVISSFLHSRTCFDLVRSSGKVVVFETNIPIQLAFYALLEHEMAAAPLWDSCRREFVGLMTITDFIDVLRYYHDARGRSGAAIEVLASRSIAQVPLRRRLENGRPCQRELRPGNRRTEVLADPGSGSRFKHATEAAARQGCEFDDDSGALPPPPPRDAVDPSKRVGDYGDLVSCDADCSLFEAVAKMARHKRRFLPIVAADECAVLAVATHVDILHFFVSTFRDERRGLFDQPVAELGIGTFVDVATVSRETPLRDVLRLLEARDLSAVPVVDEAGRVMALYGRGDITFLATATDADSVVANLATVVGDVLRQRRADEPLHTCSPQASLQYVFELFNEVKFRRLICLDDESRPVGVISPRDLLGYFLR